ncbi:unnamed protein product [Phytophthora fragariaefolia]|uniref:Kinesin-like protein n=1 Tax=Phytophthora fragariaefolia TaxID=1490495 RepID=A0A9W6TUZ1_9STRA|nr:unnamed protein product [Phytophthora fragariaefolia]
MKEPLAVREMIKGNGKQIYVSGLSEFRVTNLQETLQLLKTGNRNRTIRSTAYNEKSSRSHALLQLSIEVESRGLESATTIIRRAKLNLVDLAGSEKWDTDVVVGSDRSKELTSINQSLSALGNVISALVNPKRTHIPYRDSKLTRLLQDSLGGNTRTVVIATISPSESSVDETISTLQFAERAKCVTVRVKVNELVDDAILLAQAQREITRLKLLLKQSGSHQQVSVLEEQVARLTKEKAALLVENQKLQHIVSLLSKASPLTLTTSEEKEPANNTKRNKLTIAPQHSSPRAHRSILHLDERSPSSSSSLQLSQLRLDLKASRAETKSKPDVFTAFTDHDTENDRFERAAKAQELILQEIQTERRELERQLQLLSAGGDNQDHDHPVNKHGGQSNRSEADPCPICGSDIDDHSDAELDRCIDEEMAMVKQQRSDKKSLEKNIVQQRPKTDNVQSTGPDAKGSSRSSASDSRLRRVSRSAHGKPSPYISTAARKPSTPPQTRATSKPNGGGRGGNGSSESKLKEAFSSDKGGIPQDKSFRSAPRGDISNQADSQSSSLPPQQTPIPILRQGHKGLKALKKFRAASPYSSAVPRKEKRTISPKAKHEASTAPNKSDANGGEVNRPTTIVNSVRDIGLELSVYKFRYGTALASHHRWPTAEWLLMIVVV